MYKELPPKPRVVMPLANDFKFNVLPNNIGYFLWCVDMFTKFLRGTFIRDKQPKSIIKAGLLVRELALAIPLWYFSVIMD